MKNFICLVLLCFGLGLTVMAYPTDSTNVVQTEFPTPAVMPELEVYHFSQAVWQPIAPQVQIGKSVQLVEKTLEGFPDIDTKPPVL